MVYLLLFSTAVEISSIYELNGLAFMRHGDVLFISHILISKYDNIFSSNHSGAVAPFDLVIGSTTCSKEAIIKLQALAQHVAHTFADSTLSKSSCKLASQLVLDLAEVLVLNKLLASQAHCTEVLSALLPSCHIYQVIITHS